MPAPRPLPEGSSTSFFDLAVVGAGPGGATCAAQAADAGLRTLVLEKGVFPREKVCGDCLNPLCWPILERLGVADALRALPHTAIEIVDFISPSGRQFSHRLPKSPRGEIAVKRSVLDSLLLARAQRAGADVHQATTLTGLTRADGRWRLETSAGAFIAATLVAADGRNSTVARLLGMLPPAARDRIGWQTHFSAPADFLERSAHRVSMHFSPHGYCGVAPVDEIGTVNLCLVARASALAALAAWAHEKFPLPSDPGWRSIAPLARAPLRPAWPGLLLVGDAARVVEPFTGEGIYYALATGELAARQILAGDLAGYEEGHAALYRDRLWVNRLAKAAVLHPQITEHALQVARHFPTILEYLTTKVISDV